MNTAIKDFNERGPQLQQKIPITNGCLFRENRTIAQLKPSERTTNCVLLFIQKIIHHILHWLYPFEKTNYVGIVAALDRRKEKNLPLNEVELLQYLGRFYKAERTSPSVLAECVQDLQEQYKAQNFSILQKLVGGDVEAALKLQEKQKQDTYIKYSKQLSSLKEGQQKLILANREPGDELFYLFTKKGGELSLKIVGRGKTMASLSKRGEIAVLGREKIISCLHIEKLDYSLVEKILDFSPFGTQSVQSADFKELLERRLCEPEDLLSHLETKTNDVFQVFLSVLKEVGKNAGKTEEELERSKLRLEIFTLFSALKEYRFSLSSTSLEVQTLSRMLRICSQSLMEAYHSQQISKIELDSLVKELQSIEKTIDGVYQKFSPLASKISIGAPMRSVYFSQKHQNLALPADIPCPELKPVLHPRSPHIEPSQSLIGQEHNALHRQFLQSGVNKPVLEQLEALVKEATPHQIVQAMYDLDFTVYRKVSSGDKEEMKLDEQSPWRQLSSDQAEKIMTCCNILSKRLADFAIQEEEFPIHIHESLVKMSYIVAYLTQFILYRKDPIREFGGGRSCDRITTENNSDYQHEILGIGRFVSGGRIDFGGRYMKISGHRIHSVNLRTYQQLNEFYQNYKNYRIFPTVDENFLTGNVDLNDYCRHKPYPIEENLPLNYLRRQIEVLDYLTYGSIRLIPFIHGWFAFLPLSLLAVFCDMQIRETKKVPANFRNEHRDTPEAVQHDPWGSLRAFQNEWPSMEIRGRNLDLFYNPLVPGQEQFKKLSFSEYGIYGSSYGVNFEHAYDTEAWRRRFLTLLKKQKEYFLKASSQQFLLPPEKLTALLQIFRSKHPQKEIIAFLDANSPLLADSRVRFLVQLVFFSFLLEDLPEPDTASYAYSFQKAIPSILAKKIEEYKAKAEEHPVNLEIFLFFLYMSERLKGIYDILQKDAIAKEDQEEINRYQTDSFYPIHSQALQDFLQSQKTKESISSSARVEIRAFQLKTLLQKPELSQAEIAHIILEMSVLRENKEFTPSFDSSELFELTREYERFIDEISSDTLDKKHLYYVLDTLCTRNGLILDRSSWKGKFPVFQNNQYSVDLKSGKIKLLSLEAVSELIPTHVLGDPLFKEAFPEFSEKSEIRALTSIDKDEVKVYFFQDKHKNVCRVEERKGGYYYYRSFAHSGYPDLLQAVKLEDVVGDISYLSEFAINLRRLFTTAPKSLPKLLQNRVFIDPKQPLKAFVFSLEGKPELQIQLQKASSGLKIERIIDLREDKPSEPLQLKTLSSLSSSFLHEFQQFEHPDHVLVWGKEGGFVEKIDLPRYGLQFTIQEGSVVCQTPPLMGYKVRFGASPEERKGATFSLLLEHPDRSRPKKLLLPPAYAVVSKTHETPFHPKGFARIVSALQSLYKVLCKKMIDMPSPFSQLEIKDSYESLPFTAIDLRPHTEEFMYTPGKEIEQSQELILQAIAIGEEGLALDVLRSIEIPNEDVAISKWFYFLNGHFNKRGAGYGAAIGLKIAEKLFARIQGQEKYKKFLERLQQKERDLLQGYVKKLPDTPLSWTISKETFHRIALDIKKNASEYYQKHLAPYFLKVGDSFELFSVKDPLKPAKSLEFQELEKEEKFVPNATIRSLEELVHPSQPIHPNSLARNFALLAEAKPLIWEEKDVAPYFKGQDGSLSEGRKLLQRVVEPKLNELSRKKKEAKANLKALLRSSSDPVEQLAIYAREKRLASDSELLLALLQQDFEQLEAKKLLPHGVDLQKLKKLVLDFYELEVQFHLVFTLHGELSNMLVEQKKSSSAIWGARSKALLKQLTYKREYNPEELPQLLAFEALHFITFRNNGISQIQLVKTLLKELSGIVQAGTGSGKSSVLSVLWLLMRANGTNLVIQEVLPHLYQETLAILQTRLGSLKGKIYPLLFNQSTPLYDKDGNSLFQQIYYNLLETIQNKGCVLTDYKSLPLLEQKFWSLSKQLLSYEEMKVPLPKLMVTHWVYLMEIMRLLKNRSDLLLDEYDQALNSVQRIQTQMHEGPLFDQWMIEASLEIYELLSQDPNLFLKDNLQGELPPHIREKSIQKAAWRLAEKRQKGSATQQLIYEYLIGKSEEVLKYANPLTPLEKDRLAFLKDQCTIFLPLTLSRASQSNYARSKDGKKIVTHSKGEKRNAKFGNPPEEINFTIQNYFQKKISLPTFREWLLESKKQWLVHPRKEEKRFAEIFPDAEISLNQLVYLNSDAFEDWAERLLKQANQNPKTVLSFLRWHLNSLKTSGTVISMNPQDSIAMGFMASGISATTGSLGSLHEQFQKDFEIAEKEEQEAIQRLKSRSLADPKRYDPLKSLEMLKLIQDPRFCALIDGNGTFRDIPPIQVAEALLQANPSLKKVEYYDEEGNVQVVGDKRASLTEKGFYFPEAQTRGSDQILRPDGIALLTASERGDIEDFIQQEGRMRHAQQKVLVALSNFASKKVKTLSDLIEIKKENKKRANKEDRYRAEPQRLRRFVRAEAREELLFKTCTPNAIRDLLEKSEPNFSEALGLFFQRFKSLEGLFIQSNGSQEKKAGEYFEQHKQIISKIADPVQELSKIKTRLLEQTKEMQITVPKLTEYNPEELRPFLPEEVMPLGALEEQQQEVQEELEVNNQFELEQEEIREEEQEQEQQQEVIENKVASYLPRLPNKGEFFPISQEIHSAFSNKIYFTKAYLPLDRKDPIHKRTPFDDRTPRIGSFAIHLSKGKIEKIIIGDLLDEVDSSNKDTINIFGACHYDLRTNCPISFFHPDDKLIFQTSEFRSLIAQIKFLDGMVDGYTQEELEELKVWLKQNNVEKMRSFFESIIIKHRPEQQKTFRHSQLWNLFETLSLVHLRIE